MRVASAALRLGSKVFKKMFGPEFREGQQLAAGRCVYLRIDDDLTTMEIICKALHHQYSTLMHYSDPEDLLEIAKVADKYDCSEALTPLAEFWLKDHKRYRLGPLRNCFACAYLFRRPELFTEFGNQLLLDSQEVIPDLRELYPYLQDKIQPIIGIVAPTFLHWPSLSRPQWLTYSSRHQCHTNSHNHRSKRFCGRHCCRGH